MSAMSIDVSDVLRVFRSALGSSEFNQFSSFIDSGGTSISAVLMAIRLSKLTGSTVDVKDLYRFPTPLLMTAHLRNKGGLARPDESQVLTVIREGSGDEVILICLPSQIDVDIVRWLGAEELGGLTVIACHPPFVEKGLPGYASLEYLADEIARTLDVRAGARIITLGFCLGAPLANAVCVALGRSGAGPVGYAAIDYAGPRNFRAERTRDVLLAGRADLVAMVNEATEAMEGSLAETGTIGRGTREGILTGMAAHRHEFESDLQAGADGAEAADSLIGMYVNWAAYVTVLYNTEFAALPSRGLLLLSRDFQPPAIDVREDWKPFFDDVEVMHFDMPHHGLMCSRTVLDAIQEHFAAKPALPLR